MLAKSCGPTRSSWPGLRPRRLPAPASDRRPKHHLADPALTARLLNVDSSDLLDGVGRVVGIEAKLSSTVDNTDVKNLLWLKSELGAQVRDVVVLTTGAEA